MKKLLVQEEMQVAREEQIKHKLHFQAIQAQRERQEFERIVREQQRDIEKEKAERIEKGAELGQHASLLRRQIQERERQRIEDRKQFFAESENLTSEQEDHEKKIQKGGTIFFCRRK